MFISPSLCLSLSLKSLCSHQLFFINVLAHLSIHHLLAFIVILFFSIHLLHLVFKLFSGDMAWLLLAVFLLIDQHVLLVCLHLHQQLLVLLFVKLIHVLFSFTFVEFLALVIELVIISTALLSSSGHHLLNLLVSLFDIFLVAVVSHFVSCWRLFLLLLKLGLGKHLLLHFHLCLLIFFFAFSLHLVFIVVHAFFAHDLLLSLAIDVDFLISWVTFAVFIFFLTFSIIHFHVCSELIDDFRFIILSLITVLTVFFSTFTVLLVFILFSIFLILSHLVLKRLLLLQSIQLLLLLLICIHFTILVHFFLIFVVFLVTSNWFIMLTRLVLLLVDLHVLLWILLLLEHE